MSPLFSPFNPTGTSLSQFLRSIGKPILSELETNGRLPPNSNPKIQKQTESISPLKFHPSEKLSLNEMKFVTNQSIHQNTKELSRWEKFTKHSGSDTHSGETSSLKNIWNYLLSESKDPNFVSYHTRERNENVEMVMEPSEKGFTLYVFWKAEGFGPFGILFYYEPDLKKPVRVEFVTHGLEEERTQADSQSLKQRLQELIRDFPQIGEMRFEDWIESSYNGDYR
ncbi:hypothetical protein AB3N60_08260 [Leptospira sp. WS39.C2]